MRCVIATIEHGNSAKLARVVEQIKSIVACNSTTIIVASKEVSEALPSGFNVCTVLRDSTDISSLPMHRREHVVLMRKNLSGPREMLNEFVRQAAGVLYSRNLQLGYVSIVTWSYAYAEAIGEAFQERFNLPIENKSICASKRATTRGESGGVTGQRSDSYA